jgi:peptide deformylase
MAIRKILTEDEELLHKKSKPVTEFNERLWQLLDDMAETLKQADGVGLAAPQVGVLRRVFIMDLGDGVVEVIP